MSDFFGTPKKPKVIPPEIERIANEAAEEIGFRNREPLRAPPKRRRGTTKQLHNFTMRLDMDDAEAFIRWCERERLSYREGFAELLDRVPGVRH